MGQGMQKIRERFPQYSDVPDFELAQAVHGKYYKDMPLGEFMKQIGFEATDEQKMRASMGARAVQGARDPIDAGAQMAVNWLPEGVVNAVNKGTKYVNELPVIGPVTQALGMTPATKEQVNTDIANNEREYQKARAATGQSGMDWARLTGNVGVTAPAAAAMPGILGPSAGLGSKMLAGGAAGGMFGLTQPVYENQENFGTEKAKQFGTGAAFGAAAAPVGHAAARIIKPKSSPEVQKLLSEKVDLTPGQVLGGAFKRAEEKLESAPILGDFIKSAKGRGLDSFNKAALNRAVKPIGKTVTDIGHDGIGQVRKALQDAYDDVLPKLTFKADQQFAGEVANLHNLASQMPQKWAQRFDQIYRDEVVKKMTSNGLMSGDTFKQVESKLAALAKGYRNSGDFDSRQLGDAVAELLSESRRALIRGNPSQAKRLSDINRGWAEYSRLRRAASSVASDKGVFTPAQYHNAVKAGDQTVGKRAFSEGTALGQDLSDAAKSRLANKYPDSGTWGRAALNLGAVGLGHINPAIPAGLAAAGVPYLPGMTRAMAGILAKRPQMAGPIAQGVRQYLPAVGAAASPALSKSID